MWKGILYISAFESKFVTPVLQPPQCLSMLIYTVRSVLSKWGAAFIFYGIALSTAEKSEVFGNEIHSAYKL